MTSEPERDVGLLLLCVCEMRARTEYHNSLFHPLGLASSGHCTSTEYYSSKYRILCTVRYDIKKLGLKYQPGYLSFRELIHVIRLPSRGVKNTINTTVL